MRQQPRGHRWIYEHRSHPLLSTPHFLRRLATHAGVALGLVVLSLSAGTVGYHLLGDLGWVDAFLNAAMILGGMGPVDPLDNDPAKLFAAGYALYSGITFLAISAILVAPFAHRLLHALHLERDDDGGRGGASRSRSD